MNDWISTLVILALGMGPIGFFGAVWAIAQAEHTRRDLRALKKKLIDEDVAG